MDDVTLANRAVARIGGIKIQSFAEPGPSGPIVEETYNAVVEDILGKYPWHCTKKKVKLTRQAPDADAAWLWKFKLPSERLAPPRAIYSAAADRRPFTGWEPQGDCILSDADALWAIVQWRPDPAWWPTYLRELAVQAVAAELAGALREDWQLRARLRTEVYGSEQYQGDGGQFAVAAALDAQSAPAEEIDGGRNPLIAVRHSPGDARAGFEDW